MPVRASLVCAMLVLWVRVASGSDVLSQAWEECRFQNWFQAEALFKKVARSKGAAEADRHQSQFGLALIVHHRMPGFDFEAAIPLYEGLLGRLAAGDSLASVVHLFAGRACMYLRPVDFVGARRHFQSILDSFPESFAAYDAALDLGVLEMRKPTRENILRAISVLEGELSRHPKSPFLVDIHQYCASLHMAVEDFEHCRQHLIAIIDIGPLHQKDVPRFLFQIAYLSETKLSDPRTALRYYRMFVDKIYSDPKRYYCMQRIQELEKDAP